MSKSYFYKSYGLRIESSLYFPELISNENISDVTIKFDEDGLFDENVNYEVSDDNKINDIPVFWNEKKIFKVLNGKKIIINPNIDINMDLLRTLILCQGIGALLLQRGYLMLHGSAVNIDGKGVAFLGKCGQGKSTIAALLNNRNYPIIADDVLAINFDRGYPLIFPSFSTVKLNKDVFDHIIKNDTSHKIIHPELPKFQFNAKKNFCLNPIPIKMIYILENGKKNEITTLKSQNKLLGLLQNTYGKIILRHAEKRLNLVQCANLVNNIPIKQLNIIHSFEKIEYLIKIIENDLDS